ncbi:hypothetical protein WR25_15466 [Diploscapter pachys]|uniref:Uncharacterized protein n=1 Tax=Diploscapter pachys TaxID=2018661 RepID=A0A2A2KXV0_9BILA|nr:hypothetical protein WR25_15466 [Diploscapter pachys]
MVRTIACIAIAATVFYFAGRCEKKRQQKGKQEVKEDVEKATATATTTNSVTSKSIAESPEPTTQSEMNKSEEKQPNTDPINVNSEGVRRRKPPNPEFKPIYKLPEKEKPKNWSFYALLFICVALIGVCVLDYFVLGKNLEKVGSALKSKLTSANHRPEIREEMDKRGMRRPPDLEETKKKIEEMRKSYSMPYMGAGPQPEVKVYRPNKNENGDPLSSVRSVPHAPRSPNKIFSQMEMDKFCFTSAIGRQGSLSSPPKPVVQPLQPLQSLDQLFNNIWSNDHSSAQMPVNDKYHWHRDGAAVKSPSADAAIQLNRLMQPKQEEVKTGKITVTELFGSVRQASHLPAQGSVSPSMSRLFNRTGHFTFTPSSYAPRQRHPLPIGFPLAEFEHIHARQLIPAEAVSDSVSIRENGSYSREEIIRIGIKVDGSKKDYLDKEIHKTLNELNVVRGSEKRKHLEVKQTVKRQSGGADAKETKAVDKSGKANSKKSEAPKPKPKLINDPALVRIGPVSNEKRKIHQQPTKGLKKFLENLGMKITKAAEEKGGDKENKPEDPAELKKGPLDVNELLGVKA